MEFYELLNTSWQLVNPRLLVAPELYMMDPGFGEESKAIAHPLGEKHLFSHVDLLDFCLIL